jgi:putative aldouronate transport system permease protein
MLAAKQVRTTGNHHTLLHSFKSQREMWLLCIPIIAWAFLFCYYPMYGLTMAFVNYVPGREIWQCDWVGLKYFTQFVNNPVFGQLLRNTLTMSLLGITVGFVAPILFSFSLNEIGHFKTKKLIQTASYLPHFISWVVAGTMFKALLNSDGVVSDLMVSLGLFEKPTNILNKGEWYWGIYTLVNIWKGLGWSAIIYLSAMSGVDEELYQAGAIDGLGRWGMARHITLPSILPTIVLLWIMGVGGILNAGFDQHLIIGNPLTQKYWDVVDTYTYRYGVQEGFYSMATAVTLMKSVIGFALVLITNSISRKVSDVALF